MKTWKIIIITVILALLANIFFSRYLAAKISTLPLLNKWRIISPQTPIVITNREEVRVSDSGDVLEAAVAAKPKLSVVVSIQENKLTAAGGAINLTSDGRFVTSASTFSIKGANYSVVLSDGRTASITKTVIDPATNLVFFKAALTSVPVVGLASSKNVRSGEKVLLLVNSMQDSYTKLLLSFVSWVQNDIAEKVFDSDRPSRTFGVQPTGPLVSGQALVNTSGEVIGLWDGNTIVSSDVLKKAVDLYLQNTEKINRPQFGFAYKIITATENSLLKVKQGAKVVKVNKIGPNLVSLREEDIITQVENDKISQDLPLEEVLEKYKPGDSIKVNVTRDGKNINLILVVSELK